MASIKEAIVAKEHEPEIEPTIFNIDIRTFGKDFERYYENAKKDHGVNFVRCMVSKIYERPKSGNLMVKYADEKNKIQEDEFDMVVNPLSSLEGQSAWGTQRTRTQRADIIRAKTALLRLRIQQWVEAGYPDSAVKEFLGVVGLGKVK